MSLLETALKFVQTSERLVVVTLTVLIAGLLCVVTEHYGYLSFAGLPEWTRPAGQIVWMVCAVHVAIRGLMALAAGLRKAIRGAVSFPEWYRRRIFDKATITRLRSTQGLEREALAVALYRDDNHIWTGEDDAYEWLERLRRKGLVRVTNAEFRSVHYRIHPVAWAYMKRHPNQFLYRLPWRYEPWSEKYEERKLEEQLTKPGAEKVNLFHWVGRFQGVGRRRE